MICYCHIFWLLNLQEMHLLNFLVFISQLLPCKQFSDCHLKVHIKKSLFFLPPKVFFATFLSISLTFGLNGIFQYRNRNAFVNTVFINYCDSYWFIRVMNNGSMICLLNYVFIYLYHSSVGSTHTVLPRLVVIHIALAEPVQYL